MLKKIAIAASCATLLAGGGANAAETTLRVSNWLPPTHLIVTDIIQVWADQVEKETQGRVDVQILPALGKPQAHFDLVRNGVADVAMSVDGYTADRFDLPYVVKLPFLADDATSASVAYWRTHQKHFKQHNEFRGVHLLGLWTHGPGDLHTVEQPVDELKDMQNLRVRVSGDIVQDVAQNLGMVPQFSPASETYELLSKGVVDGVLFNLDSLPAFRIDGILKHGLMVPGGLYRDSHYMIMNERKYQQLSAEDRAVIDRISGEAIAWLAGRAWDKHDVLARQKLEKAGYHFITPSAEFMQAMEERLAPLQDEWVARMKAKGIDGAQILADYKAEIEKVEAEAKQAR
jgi:TRAP-type C4-dicarboxylate transport system substrate-binding protein